MKNSNLSVGSYGMSSGSMSSSMVKTLGLKGVPIMSSALSPNDDISSNARQAHAIEEAPHESDEDGGSGRSGSHPSRRPKEEAK